MIIEDDVIKHLVELYDTPFFIYNFESVKTNYSKLINHNLNVYYAMKANPNLQLLSILDQMGSSFDVASRGEIDTLLSLNVDGSKISYGNPNKKTVDIEYAYSKGVKYYQVDNKDEIDKIDKYAPGSYVFIRLQIDGINSVWPLSEKFGTDNQIELIEYSLSKNVKPAGISFHVGSQNEKQESWKLALTKVQEVYSYIYEKYDIKLNYINLGGGLPTQYDNHIDVDETLETIDKNVKELFGYNPILFIEPGRFLQADLGILVTSVVSTQTKKDKKWIFVDAGIYSGLLEQLGGIKYPITTFNKDSRYENCVLAGPTCDSMDVINKDAFLPSNIKEKDIIILHNVGQYSTDLLTKFNGFDIPKIFEYKNIEKK